MEDEYLGSIYDENYDFQETNQMSKCRLCARRENAKYLVNIFGKIGQQNELDIKIRKCLPVTIREDDGMPKGACMDCIFKLDICSELVESSMRAYHEFLSVMTHDPARIEADKNAMPTENDEEMSTAAEPCEEQGLEDSDINSISVAQDDMDMALTIKEEPLDMDDHNSIVLEDPPEEEFRAPLAASRVEEEPAEESDTDTGCALDNVVVTSVSTIASLPTPQEEEGTGAEEGLHEEMETQESSASSANKESAVNGHKEMGQEVAFSDLELKHELLEGSARSYSPLDETEQVLDPPGPLETDAASSAASKEKPTDPPPEATTSV